MKTPICDFVQAYCGSDPLRTHMPGHKGVSLLGFEHLDITEFDGADSLYEASGIIAESEANAGSLFGAHTFYSTEGSSQCIRAMLHLAALHAKAAGKQPVIAAGRNAHRVFLSAAALLDLQVNWLYPSRADSYLSCPITALDLDKALNKAPAAAVYVTSPDYLGNMLDIQGLAEVAHRHGCLLLVDNAHGAYLKFLTPSRHPMDLGADICCDSAHKTLPALTGAAYLHISKNAPGLLFKQAKAALALFGSTSPSYLILQSLDAVNGYLDAGYPKILGDFIEKTVHLKQILTAHGYQLRGSEPIKLTVDAKAYGYTGHELAQLLARQKILTEFHDPDYLVMMLTPQTGEAGLRRLEQALLSIPKKAPVLPPPPAFHRCESAMSIRQAMLTPGKMRKAEQCLGKILVSASVGCPPAVPVVVCGERIDRQAIACFQYYGIETCQVADDDFIQNIP